MDSGAVTPAAMTLALCGDVMLGRGVDQILPHPGDPTLREPYLRDARAYVGLAEDANGPIALPVDFGWPWGDALPVLRDSDVRVLNLETSVTGRGEFADGKGIHYRMNPGNLPCLTEVRPDVCALANNHVLDFGRQGLTDTLDALDAAGVRVAGAGRNAGKAGRPAIVPAPGGGRVLVFSVGTASSGIPPTWAAGPDHPGVAYLPEPSRAYADRLVELAGLVRRPGDITIASIHWGSNWGYRVPREHVRFAHALIDGGIDIVHGHSSHHPRPIEVYRDRLVLYGCGDLVNDYEGIGGYEEFRDDLRLLYLARVDPGSGALLGLRMVPMQVHKMRLRHSQENDTAWLRARLDEACRTFGTRVLPGEDGALALSSE
jgi:poly-gamma-glutamate capsule biosynthesis protein CapA/YwtB (metallophosphatase superfamily)